MNVRGLVGLVFLHTADWHLGRTLHGASFEAAHRRFLAWLVERVVAHHVDVLVIAGDVFDRSVPSASAEAAFYGFLARLAREAPGVQVLVVAGNHDGPARLAAPAPLLEQVGSLSLRIVGGLPLRDDGALDVASLVVPLRTRGGVVRGHAVALPFLRPSDLSRVTGEGVGTSAVERARALYAQAVARVGAREEGASGLLLATGHGVVRGARLSPDSERPLLGGDEAALPMESFPAPVQYVALGHLHLAQALDAGRVRYAGAPLPLAFSERAYPHQIVIGREEGGVLRVEPERVPPLLELVRVEDDIGGALELEAALARLATLAPVEHERWVQVRVRLGTPRPALKRELAAAVPAGAGTLVSVEVERAGDAALAPMPASAYADLAPDAVLARVWSGVSDVPVPEAMTRALHEAWREAQEEHEQGLAELPELGDALEDAS